MNREEAIKELKVLRLWRGLKVQREAIDMAIEALQERPKGRWSKNIQSIGARYITYYKCSACEKSVLFGKSDFCPNCGADMRGSEQE